MSTTGNPSFPFLCYSVLQNISSCVLWQIYLGSLQSLAVSPHLQCQVSQGSPHDCSLQEPVWCKQPSNNSAGGMRNNTHSLSSLTSLPPMASNIFSSCTRSCWMLFIRMQGWRDKSRWLLLLRMPTHCHQWETLCLSTLPQVPPDSRVTQEAENAQISALKHLKRSVFLQLEIIWSVPSSRTPRWADLSKYQIYRAICAHFYYFKSHNTGSVEVNFKGTW